MSQLLAILGPTAAGKTAMAIEVAQRIGAEIISVDSMQVYRGMDIGTAKPTIVERRGVTHHMIDVAEPEDDYTVAQFRRRARAIMDRADEPLIITGGSGLHFRALVDPMSFAPTEDDLREEIQSVPLADLVDELESADPSAGMHVDLANKRRVVRAVEIYRLTGESPSERAASAEAGDLKRYVPEVEFRAVGVDPGERLDERVDQRLAEMRSGGLVDEVAGLQDRLGRTASRAVGYREILEYLSGSIRLDTAFDEIARNTKRLAKKQRTWFQRDPRLQWIPWMDDETARVDRVMEILT